MLTKKFCFSLIATLAMLLTVLGVGSATKSAPRDAVSAAAFAPPSGYHLLKKIPLGGEGGWDYLAFDSPTRRLFISRSTKVSVLNVDTGTVAGEIANTDGVHGIAFAPEFDRGFTSNGHSGTVTIFDLQTLQVIGGAKTGMNPDAIVYDPASKRVFTMNGHSNDATAIDAATGNVLGTIPLFVKPGFPAAYGGLPYTTLLLALF